MVTKGGTLWKNQNWLQVRSEGPEKFCKNWNFQCEVCSLEKRLVTVRVGHFPQKAPTKNNSQSILIKVGLASVMAHQ